MHLARISISGKLDDADIFINLFHGFPCSPGKVLKLRKAVYGLRQAPAKFKEELLSFFQQEGIVPANDSQTVFIKRSPRGVLINAVYVDDCLHFTDNPDLFREFRLSFEKRFKIKIGPADLYLGNQPHISRPTGTVSMSQEAYIDSVLNRFDMSGDVQVSLLPG